MNERELYGEADHLRKYGRDYLDRLREAGFSTKVFRLEDPSLVQRYRIDMADPLVCSAKAEKPVANRESL